MLLVLYLSLTIRILFQIKSSFTSVTRRWDVNCLEFYSVIWIFRLHAACFSLQMRQGLWDKTFQTIRVWDETYTTYSDSRLLPIDRQTHIQIDRQTDIQIDRLKNRQTDRQTDRLTDRQTGRQTHRQTDRLTDRLTDRQTDRQTGRQTDRLTDWQTDRLTDRQTGR